MQESQGQWYKSWDEEPESSKERGLTVPAIFKSTCCLKMYLTTEMEKNNLTCCTFVVPCGTSKSARSHLLQVAKSRNEPRMLIPSGSQSIWGFAKENRPFNHIFGADRILEHDIQASKMQGCARGRKGERKTYHMW